MARAFRKPESLETERRVRATLIPFLEERGFAVDDPVGSARRQNGRAQLVRGRDEQGRPVTLWVKLCWRKNAGTIEDAHSAAQLMARIQPGEWAPQIQAKVDRAGVQGATHLLLVQNSGDEIWIAASIPLHAVVPIWEGQRAESQRLIESGAIRRKKNHAENGKSPTIWVRDEEADSVAQVLWRHPEVRDLAGVPPRRDVPAASPIEDSEADLPLDFSNLGSDSAPRVPIQTSGVRRDPRVRAAVLRRSGRRCERAGCNTARNFTGFFDVHHVLRAEKGDRVWNCVTLCPNCHREAHYAPDRDEINEQLLRFAAQFK